MIMNNVTDNILKRAYKLAINNNSQAMSINHGVLFGEFIDARGNLGHEAWVICQDILVRWSDCGRLTFPLDRPYFNFRRGEFTENTTSIPNIDDLRNLFLDHVDNFTQQKLYERRADIVPIPVPNLHNLILKNLADPVDDFIERIGRSRLIIKNNNGFVFEKELILKYNADEGCFRMKGLPFLKFYTHETTNFVGPFIDGKMYRALKVSEPEIDKVVLVDIRDVYFKGIEIGLRENIDCVYFPKSEREVIDFSFYPDERILRYNFPQDMPPDGYRFQPIHLKTSLVDYALRILNGFTYAELFVSTESRLKAVKFEGVRDESMLSTFPRVEIIIGTINPAVRGSIY